MMTTESQNLRKNLRILKSNLASMGIYIFSWKVLKNALIALKDQNECGFWQSYVIPYCFENNKRLLHA